MRGALLLTPLFVLCCVPLSAADRSPDPVDPAILAAPTVEHLPTLMAALNGSGCAPKHSDVGDALVEIGEPAVAPLVERLNSASLWLIEMECVHLLGLMGERAAEAEAGLVRYLAEDNHGLPQSYARVSLAAVRGDAEALVTIIRTGHVNLASFSLELLQNMDAEETAAVIPELQAIASSATDRRATLIDDFLTEHASTLLSGDAEPALTSSGG